MKSVFPAIAGLVFLAAILLFTQHSSETGSSPEGKSRVIVSSDIGGTDPDDFQSLIHYLMYADRFHTEGLISSPYGDGRKEHILKIIDLYESDLPKLRVHAPFPEANELRSVVRQGAVDSAPPKGWSAPTEGSEWIIERAKAESDQPLWILVWGGLEDVAQALHDAPEIANTIRVYWIGGPNKKWSVNAYLYIARNFPNLWIIEANSTYRGWFIDADKDEKYDNKLFYEKVIIGRSAMGKDFGSYYKGELKMGDTPSVAYLLDGDPENPSGESWGGSFTHLPYSAYRSFDRPTTLSDSAPSYSVIKWIMKASPPFENNAPYLWMEIDDQRIDGYWDGDSAFRLRFVPKRPGKWNYRIHSSANELDGQTGNFTSFNPWPGDPDQQNIQPLNNWWSDKQDDSLYLGDYQGAKTISKWRKAYLSDWEERWKWLE